MVLKSYAKINLTLSINNKLKSGLHNIQSIYCLIDLHDKIFLKKSKIKILIKFLLLVLFQKTLTNLIIQSKKF